MPAFARDFMRAYDGKTFGEKASAYVQAAAQTVELLMTRDVLTVRPEATLREAARLMLENKIGGLPVLQGNDLVGIITESDIFRVLVQELPR